MSSVSSVGISNTSPIITGVVHTASNRKYIYSPANSAT